MNDKTSPSEHFTRPGRRGWRAAVLFACGLTGAPAIAAVPELDTDLDGVGDAADAFPCDWRRAAVGFVPGEFDFATLLFEDNWPARGDLDFNDSVLLHHFAVFSDGSGQVTGLRLTLVPRALGAQIASGVGLRLPLPAGSVASIQRTVGANAPTNLTVLADETDVVIPVVTNLRELFSGASDLFLNTTLISPAVPDGERVTVDVEFRQPVTLSLAADPFDLYFFRTDDPRHQIHRPQFSGTDTMNDALFGTLDDGSTDARAFVDRDGLPFVLSIPQASIWPQEQTRVERLWPDLVEFAASGGARATDFYATRVSRSAAFPAPTSPQAPGLDFQVCVAPSCTDGARNGAETDLDCGGPCAPCGLGSVCRGHDDCSLGVCLDNACVDADERACSLENGTGIQTRTPTGWSACQPLRPAPTLTSITPPSVRGGSPDLALTVDGAEFAPESVVQVDGAAVVTTHVSATRLVATVPAAALIALGTRAITVVTPAPGGGSSLPATLTVATPDCTPGVQVFSSIAGVQSFTVPEQCGLLTVKAWGAGGGSGCYSGGAGGFVRARVEATPGETLSVYVGQRGGSVSYQDSFYRCGGDGGGRSELRRANGTTLLVAAGGGGNGRLSDGGGGGGLSGQSGFGFGPHGINSGGGGGQGGGGGGGGSNINWGQGGGPLSGGNNAWNQGRSLGWPNGGGGGAGGGGGGDGWYGGGGGGEGWCGYACSQAGGGGSSYIGGPGVLTNGAGEGTFGASGASLAAQASADSDYLGGTGGAAQDGRVVIRWAADTVPDPFAFATLTEQAQGVEVTSAPATLAGFQGPITVSVSGDGQPGVSVDGGPFQSSVAGVRAPATLRVRITTPTSGCATSVVTVTAGERSTTWTVRNGGCQPSCSGLWASGVRADGTYPIDLDGPGGAEPRSVYCLMSEDGGGWTRLDNSLFTAGPSTDASGRIVGTVYNNGTCNTHTWWTISGVVIPHSEYRAVLERQGTVLQCSYLTGMTATWYWTGSAYASNPSTCTWSQPWAYCVNCNGTGGLPQRFLYRGGVQSSYTYTTACSAETGGYVWTLYVR